MLPVILVKNDTDMGESAAGGFHKYANPALIEQEKANEEERRSGNMWNNDNI